MARDLRPDLAPADLSEMPRKRIWSPVLLEVASPAHDPNGNGPAGKLGHVQGVMVHHGWF